MCTDVSGFSFFFFSWCGDHRDLHVLTHSFPTRRSSDLLAGRATFEDPRFVGALARLNDLKKYFPPGFIGVDYPSAQQLFIAGRAAMFVGGSYEIANFQRQNPNRSEEHTSELPSLMRNSYAVFCLKKKKHEKYNHT